VLMKWTDVVAVLQDTAAARGGDAFVRDTLVVLSPRGEGVPIHVRDAGEDGVMMETGWVIRLVADRAQHTGEPPYFLQLVEAIMDGQATESAILDADGNWVDVAFTITSPHGISSSGNRPDQQARASRTLPAWT
jgi:hypothetical protein